MGHQYFYKPQRDASEKEGSNGTRNRTRLTGDSLEIFFLDHIAENDKKQDRFFVASNA